MKKNDALIFDIDGTLWNASESTAEGWNNAFAEMKISARVTGKQVEAVSGKPFEECVDILFPGLERKRPGLSDFMEKRAIEAVKKKGGLLYEGAKEGIIELSKKYKIFLLSNSPEWYMKLFIKFSGLCPFLFGYDCFGLSRKEKAQMIINMKNNYSLNNPVYIGDTIWDEEASKKAGVNFLHVAYGFGHASDESIKFNSFEELKNFLLEQS